MQSIDNFWKRAHRVLLECLLRCFIRRKKVLEMVGGGGALLQKKCCDLYMCILACSITVRKNAIRENVGGVI
jgi:hypothetical protein